VDRGDSGDTSDAQESAANTVADVAEVATVHARMEQAKAARSGFPCRRENLWGQRAGMVSKSADPALHSMI